MLEVSAGLADELAALAGQERHLERKPSDMPARPPETTFVPGQPVRLLSEFSCGCGVCLEAVAGRATFRSSRENVVILSVEIGDEGFLAAGIYWHGTVVANDELGVEGAA